MDQILALFAAFQQVSKYRRRLVGFTHTPATCVA
jgi:hypothetical protein